MRERLADLGEIKVLGHVLKIVDDHLSRRRQRVFGIGDDAQAIYLDGQWLFLKVDGTTASSSMYPWLTYGDFGYRVALSAVTDLIAKNSRPLMLASSITLSSDFHLNAVLDIVSGVKDLAEVAGSIYVGGDINKLDYDDVVLDVASIGISTNPKASTPFRGDLSVYSVRCLGLSSIPAALYYLKKDLDAWNDVLRVIARPEPPLKFLTYSDLAGASTDISDGLSSIRRVLEKSGSDLVLTQEALCPEVLEFSVEEGVELSSLLGFMGEEYTVLSTASSSDLPALKVGYTVKGTGRVYLDGRELRGGWDNFLGYVQ